jgi:hypothetical protein
LKQTRAHLKQVAGSKLAQKLPKLPVSQGFGALALGYLRISSTNHKQCIIATELLHPKQKLVDTLTYTSNSSKVLRQQKKPQSQL